MTPRPTAKLSRLLLTLGVALAAAVAGARSAPATLLVVDLTTDYVPAEEFAAVRTRVAPVADLTDAIYRSAPALGSSNYLSPVRVAEFDVPSGSYRLTVDLLDGAGEVVARQQVLVDLTVALAATVPIARPHGSIEKSAALWIDADGDGGVSGGDTLRYTVVALGGGGERFVDELASELALVAGSVTTTHGVVVEGNSPGDTRVEIGAMATTAAATATIEFDAVVLPEVGNQGELLLESGSFDPAGFEGNYRSRRIPTDDPSTAPLGDPTRTPVACDLASCAGDLATCEDDLATCAAERAALEDEVAMLEAELGTLMADPDGDGTPAVLDLCPDSEPGAPVDDRGCTIAQFCAAIDLSAPQGNNLCNHADWGGDEPLGNPRDCRPTGGACAPR